MLFWLSRPECLKGATSVERPVFRRKEGIVLAILLLFLIFGFIAGAYLSSTQPGLAKSIFREIFKGFKKLLTLTGWRLVLGIFINNLRVAMIMILIGSIIPFMPGTMMFINGFIIGLVSQQYTTAKSAALSGFILALAPHGVLEIPAIMMAAVVGTILGWDNWRSWLLGAPHPGWRSSVRYALVWLAVITALLIPAAIIEVFVTPLVMG